MCQSWSEMEAIAAVADASPFERVSTRISRGPRRESAENRAGRKMLERLCWDVMRCWMSRECPFRKRLVCSVCTFMCKCSYLHENVQIIEFACLCANH